MLKNCLVCKKEYNARESKAKYCGRTCYYIMKKQRGDRVNWTPEMKQRMSEAYMGKGNPMYGVECWNKGKKRPEISGTKHFNYKGGWMQEGYKYICVEGRQVGEHTYLIEQKLGRRLTSNEIVHHLNHNKLDNRLENLQLLTRSEHIHIHPACLEARYHALERSDTI